MKWNFETLFMVMGLILCIASGCRHGMEEQPKAKALAPSDFFADGRSARMPVAGTVPRGHFHDDELLVTGKINGHDSRVFPFPITKDVLQRGQERYDIFCAACHDRVGNGSGMVVRRGFPQPPSFHTDRLREAPVGHYFDVITNGFGTMYPYAGVVPVNDRWAIIAYIRALQRSQRASMADVPPSERNQLERSASR